jgi:hypothetical protein
VDHDVVEAAKNRLEGDDGAKMIDVGGDQDNEQDQVIKDILDGNAENEILTKFIKVLNKILSQKRQGTLWVIAFKDIGGQESFNVARYTFAAIVKLSCLANKLLDCLSMLEIQEPSAFDDLDGAEGDDEEKLKALVGLVKTEPNCEIFIKEWENATKMRKWFNDEK